MVSQDKKALRRLERLIGFMQTRQIVTAKSTADSGDERGQICQLYRRGGKFHVSLVVDGPRGGTHKVSVDFWTVEADKVSLEAQ